MTFKAAVGLYQWLRPTDITDNNWSVGTCAGYQQSMLAEITDPFFDMSRSFAVFAVILAIFQVCWMLLSACMSMNRIQAYLFCILAFAGTASTGLTFLFHRSALCQTQFQSRECVVDEGGLVMIAASVLWMVTFCISICFVVPTVLAETSSIDFERQDAHDRAKIAAKKTKDDANRLRGRSNTKPNASSSRRSKSKSDRASQQQNNDKTRTTILAVQQSYSYDSQASWTKRIPTRSGFTDDVLQERPTKAKSSLLIVPGKRTPSLSLPQRSSQQQLQPQQQQRYGPLSSQTLFRTAAQPNTGSTHVQDSVENYIAKRLDRIEALSADVP